MIPDVYDRRSTSCTNPLMVTRLVCEPSIQWSGCWVAWVDIKGGDMGDSWVEGDIGDGSHVFWLRNWDNAGFVIREEICSLDGALVTVAQDDVMNAFGMSWGCHILHRDFTAWSEKSVKMLNSCSAYATKTGTTVKSLDSPTRPMTYLLFWTSQVGKSLEAWEITGGVIIAFQRQLFPCKASGWGWTGDTENKQKIQRHEDNGQLVS